MLTFSFTGAEGTMIREEVLTSGMVGKQVRFVFSPEWENLHKTAVYSAGRRCVIHGGIGEVDTIPAEVLECPAERLYVGIYGVSEDGSRAIPTLRAKGPEIRPGADPNRDPAAAPELPVWAQLLAKIGDLEELRTQDKASLVEAINSLRLDAVNGKNGATYFPAVSEEGMLSWSNNAGLPNPAPVKISGPAGADGQDGYSPVRGTDYWTEEDIAQIKNYVDEAILGGEW